MEYDLGMHSAEIRSATFSSRPAGILGRLFGGELFVKADVDALLERCARALESYEQGAGGTDLDPDEIVVAQFAGTRFGAGYDPDEVDGFLDEIVVELRRRAREQPGDDVSTPSPSLLASAHVRGRTFAVRGYNAVEKEEVDAFVALSAEALQAHEAGKNALLTSEHVRAVRFTPTGVRLGYDAEEVDDFVGDIVATLRAHEASPH